MGVKATAVSTIGNGKMTICMFKVGKDSNAITFRTVKSATKAAYKADMNLAKSVGQIPKTDNKFSPNRAFSTSISSAALGFTTHSVTVLKGSTEVQVTAVSTLAKVEALAKVVLSKV